MRALGLVVAVVVAAGGVLLYLRATVIRPWQSRRRTARLLRENDELDRRLDDLRRERNP